MKVSTESKIYLITLFLGALYFLYSIIISTYDFINIKHKNWVNAENQSTVYSSRRSTTVTYNFIKDNVKISRTYPGILEGINTWIWGIDKKALIQNISFYIRKKDEQKIKYNRIHHQKDIFGNKLDEIEPIPFFGLRTINSKANAFLLVLDIWKYNYSILVAFVLLILPYFIFFILKKIFKIVIEKNQNKEIEKKIGGYQILFFILLVINLLV
ncbi:MULTISPECIES: hypothetical protein [Chryseobacterium]|uniref:DUF3592 domain-containing protein n=1 Tax=Chryseobacterium camelliae TaxID=1265445 RepID=A0ABU0TKB2_9FLAO|nr:MULTISPECIES: hypothetical protein [Chryseobacterium]MDT3408928.1 hypothetical protein [Pseudacidovorax intermedius]MDQ1097216.1 hypothetical protein [Chryseobacterium camelliae]MDQ1101151.1 hypothetical protein [Chryseobacterium sp. SORGH_AS_1048]MDR6084596.1 hypothetical protein [Chryseobacterium sp. SORGH_AS_0909]MDR6132868.1 hypothetical protein [Chryseobacterium sp. SORGH_AS_1175]